MTGKLLILGCGALAREVALAIPTILQSRPDEPFTLILAGRDGNRAAWLGKLVRARAFAGDVSGLSISSCSIHWESTDQLAGVIAKADPTAILNTASLQSAWSLTSDNAWSQLVRCGGYAVTAALQAALLPKLARALASARVRAPVINACYPDVINAGCSSIGLPVTCGIGNVALLAELFRQHLRHSGSERLRVLAGHFDVDQYTRSPELREAFPLVWRGNHQLSPNCYSNAPALSGDVTMNSFSAGASAALLHAIASGTPWVGHAPGPLGELGGYPVVCRDAGIKIDLPGGVSLRQARQWNKERCERDGATVEAGYLRFSPPVTELLRALAPDLASGFAFADVESAARAFLELRSTLSNRKAA